MLDVSIQRNPDGRLSFDVYRKPTHTNQYIHFASHAPLEHKMSTIHSLTRRAAIIPSTQEAKKNEEKRIRDALALNGYPDWAFEKGRYKEPLPPEANANNNGTNSVTPTPQRHGHVTLPYFTGITEPLSRALRNAGITSSVRARGTLREELVHPKDKLEKSATAGIVYHLGCAGSNGVPCPGQYVGESERTIKERGKEHFSTSRQSCGSFKSAVMQHAADHHHHFRQGDFSILAREPNYHARGIREAIHIRALSPSINREDARHQLPHNYDTIIKASARKPPQPQTHEESESRLHTTPRGRGRPPTLPQSQQDTSSTLPKTATAATPPAAAIRTQRPPSHTMTTRRRAAQSQEDRATPD